MSVDANKTGETRRITELAAQWLGEKGFKPVESEVPVAERWIADIAGAAVLSRTEAIALKMIRRKPSWTATWRADQDKWDAEFNTLPQVVTAAIEVKVSRSDFSRDDKWERERPTHLLYVAAPSELLSKIKIPDGIGVLSVGETIRCTRPSSVARISETQVTSAVYSIAMRRDHFTSYQRYREFERQAREDSNARTNAAKLSEIIRVVIDVRNGIAPMDAVARNGVRLKDRDYVIRQLEQLQVGHL